MQDQIRRWAKGQLPWVVAGLWTGFGCGNDAEQPGAAAAITWNAGSEAADSGDGSSSAQNSPLAAGAMGAPANSPGASQAELCRADASLAAGVTPLRRLTRTQLDHVVRDVLAVGGNPGNAIAPDERIGPFDSNATSPITDLLVQQHAEVAARIAQSAVGRMAEIAPCDLSAQDEGVCRQQFIEGIGLQLYRRPLDGEEVSAYAGLFDLGAEQGAVNGFRLVLEAMLQSPFFLYHADLGQLGVPSLQPVALTGYEVAARLSFFLWDTIPDDELFARAGDGSLLEPAQLAQQVDRMLDDPRALDAIPNFHLQWLGIRDMGGIEKDTELFPAFNEELVAAMVAETANFSDYVIRRGDGLLSTLFTADYSVIDGPLFDFYGLERPEGFTSGDAVPINTAQRAGILTQAAFLTSHAHRDQTSPVHRGLFIRENVLCQPIPPPPPDVIPTAPAPRAGTTMRERIAEHQDNPACYGCHSRMDGIGLGFESFDALGAFRATEDGRPVDASGELLGMRDEELNGAFDGAIELSEKFATSAEVQQCMARQWFRFALGRSDARDDACTMQQLAAGLEASGGNIRDLIVRIVVSDAFRHVRTIGEL